MKLCNPEIKNRLQKVRVLAKEAGYSEMEYQDNIGMVLFSKKLNGAPCRVNIYITKMTVATALKHPKKGKTQIYMRYASFGDIRKLFNNPRAHTGRRYYTK